jgi:heme A synthase
LKPGVILFRVTGFALGIQLLLGGLLTFGFISAFAHIVFGFVLFALAIATMVVWLVTKPPFRPLQGISVVIVVLILVQIVLGFATLESGSQFIAFVHFVNAMAILGVTVAGTVIAVGYQRSSGHALHVAVP